jgi:putative NIF3 family GTP cyclohydrolase 1 type 2
METKRDHTKYVNSLNRRDFILSTSKVAVAGTLITSPFLGKTANLFAVDKTWTVGEIIDLFITQIPYAPFKNAVDTLKSGSLDMQVSGIVTTMFATIAVIKETIDLGANFIIAHEPTFYNHQDDTKWLENDDVFNYKMGLLKKHNITVWRNHDYIHSLQMDGVMAGVLAKLNWQSYYDPKQNHIVMLPDRKLGDLITQVKQGLGISKLRYIGDLQQNCRKILLIPGAAGGMRQISAMIKEKPDVLICGEVSEWETAEYVRDAQAKGDKLALIVTGHIASEEPGAEFMLGWLHEHVPGVIVTHVPAGNSLQIG